MTKIRARDSIRTRLLIAFTALVAIPVLVTSTVSGILGAESLKQRALDQLESVAVLKEAEVTNWLAELYNDLTLAILADENQAAASTLLGSDAEPNQDTYSGLEEHLQRVLISSPRFQELFILNSNNQVILSTDAAQVSKIYSDWHLFTEGAQGPDYIPPFYSPSLQAMSLIVARPILNKEGQLLGALAGRASLNALDEIMQESSGLGATAETYLIGLNHAMLTRSRFENGSENTFVRSAGASDALANQSRGSGIYINYRGQTVAGVYRWLPDLQMALLAEQELAEPLGELLQPLTINLGLTTVLFVVAIFVGSLIARNITDRLIGLSQTAEQIADGNLGLVVDVKRHDEIGELALVFNNMTAQLKKHRDHLEELVAERTREMHRLVQAVEQSIDGVAVANLEGEIIFVNHAWAQMHGYSPEELVGKPLSIFHNQKQLSEEVIPFNKHVLSQGSHQGEIGHIDREGRILPTWMTTAILKNPAGEPVGFVGTARDITERKAAENEIKKYADELARSNQELEQFAYVASHDLQEPLRMVSSFTQMLARQYQDQLDADAQEFITYAVEGANRMQRLINDLLTFSRVRTSGEVLELVDMNEVLAQVRANLSMAIEEENVQIAYDALPVVMGDDSQLVQLMQNLIANAIKFKASEPPHIQIAATFSEKGQEEGKWVFSVQDNGIGIDPQYAERIFVIFQRLHTREEYPGTGIGLAVCKRIVDRHGGKIWLDSQPGEGATFFFTLAAGSDADVRKT